MKNYIEECLEKALSGAQLPTEEEFKREAAKMSHEDLVKSRDVINLIFSIMKDRIVH